MKERTHDEAMAEQFRADPGYAAELLTEVRRNGESAELAIILRQMAQAFGRDEWWSLVDAERKLLIT
ncbi:transcriptional regulator [Pseudomonas fragi]|uniref:Transcriptional regulator n=1 Tax=Pseudomonas fragi TaxID=296 RepID=A0A9Q5B2G2_PSEFR|nr:transcriptional regulator [Pseudomonas fragi]NNB50427.1 transcriptional regulator [Pseudomonas fragi]